VEWRKRARVTLLLRDQERERGLARASQNRSVRATGDRKISEQFEEKEIFMEEKMIMHRQGDVLFVKVVDLPPSVVERMSDVLAEGEATGHAHRLTEGQIWQTREGLLYLRAVAGSQIVHEEHAPIELEPGYWQVIRQREYSPEAIRSITWVRD
jgi:hypothetical protein